MCLPAGAGGQDTGARTATRDGTWAGEMTTLRELLLHDLGQLLAVERRLASALATLSEEAHDPELRRAFARHRDETRRHAADVERAFELLGEAPLEQRSAGIEGIVGEQRDFLAARRPAAIVLDMFLTGVAARAEHYEICVYEGVVGAARMMGENEATELLQRNLDDEHEALAGVMRISERLTAQSLRRRQGVTGSIAERLP